MVDDGDSVVEVKKEEEGGISFLRLVLVNGFSDLCGSMMST